MYYSVEALEEGIDRYNEALRGVCRVRGSECIEAASVIPKTTTVFWDDAHYTAEGARMLAALVTDYLLAHEPLRSFAEASPRPLVTNGR